MFRSPQLTPRISPLFAQNPHRRKPAVANATANQQKRPSDASPASMVHGEATATNIDPTSSSTQKRKRNFRRTFSLMFPRLQAFQEKYGHSLVPQDYQDQELYLWTRYLRRHYRHQFTDKVRYKKKSQSSHTMAEPPKEWRRALLSESKARMLESLFFCWDVQEHAWEQRREALQDFLRIHGHEPSPAEDPTLAAWLSNQMRDYRFWLQDIPSPMTPERVEDLEALGVLDEYRTQHQAWSQHYQYLVEYHQIHGNVNVPQRYLHPVEITVVVAEDYHTEQRMTTFPLGQWCMNQRTARRLWDALRQEPENPNQQGDKSAEKKKKSKESARQFLTAERIRLLDALDFSWNLKAANWQLMLKRLQGYYKRHGHLKIPTNDIANRDMMNWLIDQRYYYHLQRREPPQSSPLTPPRVEALEEAIPNFSWKHYNASKGPTTEDWSNLFSAMRDKGIVPGMKPKLHWFDGVNPLTMEVKTEWTEQELIDLWNQEEDDDEDDEEEDDDSNMGDNWSVKEKVRQRRRRSSGVPQTKGNESNRAMGLEDDEEAAPPRRRSCRQTEVVTDSERFSTTNVSLQAMAAATTSARSMVQRTSSVVWEERPKTPTGWAVLVAVMASVLFGYELQLQQQLTCPPFVFLQDAENDDNRDRDKQIHVSLMQAIYKRLTQSRDSILSQPIRPSLWVGTRSLVATSLSVVTGIPQDSDQHVRFREIAHMPADGATVALDWEAPLDDGDDATNLRETVLKGPIHKPVVLILHGLNNNSSSGYIRSLQRTITNRGHIAVGMNFRGCGGHPLSTPRAYTGAYTGDLRSVIHRIQGRLASDEVPLFLVGHSLGANLVTKYLGEEGLSGTLPRCIAGGASLANPLEIHSKKNTVTPWKQLMAWGVKMNTLAHWRTWKTTLAYPEIRRARWAVLMATTIDQVDDAIAPIAIRNDPYYPFAVGFGYKSTEELYDDCSSYRFIKHVSVPLLQIIAGDDPVVYKSFQRKLTHSVLNPNVMSVETKCGGHLGWQESPPPGNSTDSDRPSWAGRATADFIDAILDIRRDHSSPIEWRSSSVRNDITRQQTQEPATGSTAENCNREHFPVLQSRL